MRKIPVAGIGVVVFVMLALLFCNGDEEPPAPPDPTDNNTIEKAWDVSLPYTKEFTIPADDPAEVFHFGIGPNKPFASVIVVKIKLIEPTGTPFYLRAELLSENQTLLVSSRDAELVPSAWVASRSNQLYYLCITPVGDPGSDRYKYSIEIASSTINDPLEPDDDTASATPIILGIETTGAYLCSPFSDSTVSESMKSLPDFYSLELEDSTDLYLSLEGIGSDGNHRVRLYDPTGTLVAETADTVDTFVIVDFQSGKWYIEVDEKSGFYPQYGEGEVSSYYLSRYTLLVDDEPQK